MHNFRAFRDFEEVYGQRAAARRSNLVAYVLLAAISLGASYVSLSLAQEALTSSIDTTALARFLPEAAVLPPSLTSFLQTPIEQFLPSPFRSAPPAFAVAPPTTVDRSAPESEPAPTAAQRLEFAEAPTSAGGISEITRRAPASDSQPVETRLRFVAR